MVRTVLRATPALVVVAVMVVLTAACNSGAGAGSDEDRVRALFERQLRLAREHDWQGLYETYAETSRERCPFDRFEEAWGSLVESVDLDDLERRDVRVRVDGERAYVTYVAVFDGEEVDAVTEDDPDTYVKVDGEWYDDEEPDSMCGA